MARRSIGTNSLPTSGWPEITAIRVIYYSEAIKTKERTKRLGDFNMLALYIDPHQQYLAVHPQMKFQAINGFKACFGGRLVPLVLCDAYIREFGGRYFLGGENEH